MDVSQGITVRMHLRKEAASTKNISIPWKTWSRFPATASDSSRSMRSTFLDPDPQTPATMPQARPPSVHSRLHPHSLSSSPVPHFPLRFSSPSPLPPSIPIFDPNPQLTTPNPRNIQSSKPRTGLVRPPCNPFVTPRGAPAYDACGAKPGRKSTRLGAMRGLSWARKVIAAVAGECLGRGEGRKGGWLVFEGDDGGVGCAERWRRAKAREDEKTGDPKQRKKRNLTYPT